MIIIIEYLKTYPKYHLFSVIRIRASLVAQTVKNLPAMQETPVLSLTWEDLLEEEGMAQFSLVQSLSHVRLFATPWTAAC